MLPSPSVEKTVRFSLNHFGALSKINGHLYVLLFMDSSVY